MEHRLLRLLSDQISETTSILGNLPLRSYVPVDLSVHNGSLDQTDISDPMECKSFLESVLAGTDGLVAYGGYLEQRKLYARNLHFTAKESVRDIHLGMDFWAREGTEVVVPFEGKVHSFRNNATLGDYGPTIILEHMIGEERFHTLYGHLSIESLQGLYRGKGFKKGDRLGFLGTTDINVNYAPHLHFQIVVDLQGKSGDYPGVCAMEHLGFYAHNSPDPNLLLKIR